MKRKYIFLVIVLIIIFIVGMLFFNGPKSEVEKEKESVERELDVLPEDDDLPDKGEENEEVILKEELLNEEVSQPIEKQEDGSEDTTESHKKPTGTSDNSVQNTESVELPEVPIE